ncbi:MAG TPA: hypothetical protein VMF09_15570 [Solirubrobacteraceae bacterium]|nr:hypothetical protein [Solirubrobacteraceae bacterium]
MASNPTGPAPAERSPLGADAQPHERTPGTAGRSPRASDTGHEHPPLASERCGPLASERCGPLASERYGPLALTRLVKDDGRALILYHHADSGRA